MYHKLVHQFINDDPSYTSFESSSRNIFDSSGNEVNSTFRWAMVASIVYALVLIIAIVAIVYVVYVYAWVVIVVIVAIVYGIIYYLRKAGTAIPSYARLATNDNLISKTPDSMPTEDPPAFPVIPESQVNIATMERFFKNMEKEKPMRFSPEQIARFTKNCSTRLGSGGYGVVYKGEFQDGVQVAVKVLNNNSIKRIEDQFMAEVSTLGRTNHTNLVRLYEFCFDPAMRALVYEYMENGSLNNFLFDENRTIEWEKLHEISIGTARGLAYLHEECHQRIIHYDIKPENVLLDADLSPKVADFGLAKLCNRDGSEVAWTGFKGTPGHAAPELWDQSPVTRKCDVYSFGILLFEIVGRRRHYDDNVSETKEWLPRWTWEMFEKDELLEMLTNCGIEEKDRENAERMCVVALWCVQHSPEARPLMSKVVKMLEGGVEIVRPPHPFEHLESSGLNLAVLNGSNGDLSSSASTGTSLEKSGSIPMMKALEMEIAHDEET